MHLSFHLISVNVSLHRHVLPTHYHNVIPTQFSQVLYKIFRKKKSLGFLVFFSTGGIVPMKSSSPKVHQLSRDDVVLFKSRNGYCIAQVHGDSIKVLQPEPSTGNRYRKKKDGGLSMGGFHKSGTFRNVGSAPNKMNLSSINHRRSKWSHRRSRMSHRSPKSDSFSIRPKTSLKPSNTSISLTSIENSLRASNDLQCPFFLQ